MAVTFTNKAAAEMKKRARDLTGELAGGIWIGTFHSICLRILKMEADFLEGYTKDFVVYDQNDQLGLLKSCLKKLDYGESLFSPKGVLSEFDAVENSEEVSFRDDFYGRRLKELYDFYKKELVKRNAMTFNDLLLQTNSLLSENEGVRNRYQDRFSHVLVDEYQDTNTVQYQFVRIFSERRRNLFVVGDDSQSIYGWRGADIRNILNFEKDFLSAKVVKLERNYRSTPDILAIANSVIRKNPDRKEKTLWTENPVGEKTVVFKADNSADEARFVAGRISSLVGSGDFSWGDVAIFYRANFQSRVIEEGLRAAGIPYRIVSGVGFYQRAEIKDVVAYLRLVQNPRDDVSFLRIVNVPPRKVGAATVRKLREVSATASIGFMDAIDYCENQKFLLRGALPALSGFRATVTALRSLASQRPAAAVIKLLLERTGYLEYLGDEIHRVENVKELVALAKERGDMPLSDFLDLVSLSTDEDRTDSGGGMVSLMTVHAAKGLEFPAVFMVGMNDGLFPHQRSELSAEGVEEERRLFYVAITRAERLLYLSYSFSSKTSDGRQSTGRSRFLNDIPEELTDFESRWGDVSEEISGKCGSPAQKLPRPTAGARFRSGQKVNHRNFGRGVVRKIEGKGSSTVVTVDFFGPGRKKVLADFLAD